MANFYTALEALGSGRTSLESISLQLKQILAETPDYSHHLRSHLFRARSENLISGNIFDRLNNIIEPYLLDSDETSLPNATSGSEVFIDIDNKFPNEELTTGKVIKHRFQLLEILGVGGMGRVYKGIDLLKQEAQDKDPYVAIKLLNEDFKSHPKAFISLQRESSRQQKLAHPNIATVFDFDRVGGPGTPVFIIMELLEGQTLNTFIKTRLRRMGGLPFSEAIKIIRQLSSALAYAHDRGVVHSDFKPGNAFVCLDGTVKVLDFGIARAVTNPIEGDAERTLFDPRNLGAFTPAYASLEMLQGIEPDPRDDIYALGCVAYELLTGKHPYDKLPANKIQEQGKTYQPIKGLKRRQNKTLEKSLSCDREQRCQSVEQFIEDLEAKYVWYKDLKTMAAVLLCMLGVAAYMPVKNHFDQQRIAQLSQSFNSGSTKQIEKSLIDLQQLDTLQKLTVSNEAKSPIQNYFANEIAHYTDISNKNYDFIKAASILKSIEELYPDSRFATRQREHIETNKESILNTLYIELANLLSIPDSVFNSINILKHIQAKIDPQHALLKDQSIIDSYYSHIQKESDYEDVQILLNHTDELLNIFQGNQKFIDLKQSLQNKHQLQIAKHNLKNLIEYDDIKAIKENMSDIQTISTLDPDWPEYKSLKQNIKQLISIEIAKIESSGNRADADKKLDNYSTLLSSLGLHDELTQLKLLHLQTEKRDKIILDIISETSNKLDNAIQQAKMDSNNWHAEVITLINILESLTDTSGVTKKLIHYQTELADLLLGHAKQMNAEQRYKKAKISINHAKQFMPFLPDILNTELDILAAEKNYNDQLKIAAIKKQFELKVDANEIIEASRLYQNLHTYIPENDYYLLRYAPKRLADSHLDLAKEQFRNNNYQVALDHVNSGLDYYPYSDGLKRLKTTILVEMHSNEISKAINADINFDHQLIREKFGVIERSQPRRYLQLRQQTIDILKKRIELLAKKDANQAMVLAQNAIQLFPGSSIADIFNKLKPSAWPDYENSMTLLGQGKLSVATELAQSIDIKYQQHPDFLEFNNLLALEKDNAGKVFQAYLTKRKQANNTTAELIEAQQLLQQAQLLWVDNSEYIEEARQLEQTIQQQKPQRETIAIREQQSEIAESDISNINLPSKTEKKTWQPQSNSQQCMSQFAAYGRRARAICYDLVNEDWRGPLMVVIPASNTTGEFAISKYEITTNDFSKYCVLSQRCKPVADKAIQDMPQTGINLQQAEQYVEWLSDRTGKRYRLPTLSEWQHAATAAGKQPDGDVNCRLQVGNKLIKGMEIVSTRTGKSNGWGLKNYLGNVQEWVFDDNNSLLAAGGAYSDNPSKCTITFTRNHNGQADSITGFRVVLEDIES